MPSISIGKLAVAAALAFGPFHSVPSAFAQDQTFRVTQVFPATHWHWVHGMKTFTEEIEKATGGKIAFEVYNAGQLGQESTSLVSTGVADLGLIVPSYEAEKLPLTSVAELPGLHTTACEGTAKVWNIAREGGALYEAEYRPLGLHPLYAILLRPYEVMTNSKQVKSLEDLQGLKIRANGAAMDKTVRNLGAVPVRVTSNELYDSLSRGTVDGGMWLAGSIKTVGLEGQFNYTVQGTQLGGGVTLFAMNQSQWESLDDATKQIFTEAGAKTQQQLCEFHDHEDIAETKRLSEEKGFVATMLPPEEAARWSALVAPVADDWAAEMDSTGRPGTAILEAFRAAPAAIN